jgi:hypothetical protein
MRERLFTPLVVYKSQRRAGPRPARSRVRETWAFANAAGGCVIGLGGNDPGYEN